MRATPCSQIINLRPGSFALQIASAKRPFLHGQTPQYVIDHAVVQLKLVLPWRYHHLPLSIPRAHQKFTKPPKKHCSQIPKSYLFCTYQLSTSAEPFFHSFRVTFSLSTTKLLSPALVSGRCFPPRDPSFPQCCSKARQDGWFLISPASRLSLLEPSPDLL